MTDSGQSYSEEVLDGRLVVTVYKGRRHVTTPRSGTLISIGSFENRAGTIILTSLGLAALLDGPLARALKEANRR